MGDNKIIDIRPYLKKKQLEGMDSYTRLREAVRRMNELTAKLKQVDQNLDKLLTKPEEKGDKNDN